MKLHLAMSRDTKLPGGQIAHVTFTLCGRENAQSTDGTNSTPVHSEVTCGHCQRIMQAAWFKKKMAA